jgi:recombination protein RecT
MARGLSQRVADNAAAQANGGTLPMSEQIRRMESQFALAMPRGAEASQLVRDALTSLRQTPKLAECEAATVLGGLMTCAQLGLRPGVLGHAWLVPFWNSRRSQYEAQLIVGYQGLVDLAHRSGRIASLIARTVYENDHFDVDYGLADTLVHKPVITGERGKPIAYYAIAKFTTGGHAFIVASHDEMLGYRSQFAMSRTREGKIIGPWEDHFEAMAHKTCVRQLSKWMPKSTELATAIEADNSVRVDLDPKADPATESHAVIGGEIVRSDEPDAPADAPVPPAAEAGEQ